VVTAENSTIIDVLWPSLVKWEDVAMTTPLCIPSRGILENVETQIIVAAYLANQMGSPVLDAYPAEDRTYVKIIVKTNFIL